MIALDGVDISTIHVVLLTQYEQLLGLPYLTEYLGYKGKIIATEPTIEFARQRMEELVHYRSTMGSSSSTTGSSSFTNLLANDSFDWQTIYTLKDIACCIEKIQPVRFNEKMSLFSTLNVMAYSSGYTLGSCNWLIETSMKKIVVLSASSSRPELHPALLDHTIMQSADVLLVSGINENDQNNRGGDDANNMMEPTYEQQLKKCLSYIAGTLASRHNVILPLSITSGLVYDLIWMIQSHLRSLGMEIGPESHQIPIYMISPMAEQSLQYANICGEWMTIECQEQLWRPEMPLPHGQLLKSGALTTFSTMTSIPMSKTKKLQSSPCLVFTGDHQVLSHGATDWFLQNWGTNSYNLCILTDPSTPTGQLQYYDQSAMTLLHLPLDTRLTMVQVLELIRLHWRPSSTTRHLVLPRTSLTTSQAQSHGLHDVHSHLYSPGEMIDLDLGFEWEQISISNMVAKDIKLIEVPWMATAEGSRYMAPISGDLEIYNNQLNLKQKEPRLDANFVYTSSVDSTNDHVQALDVSDLMAKLHKIGIYDITTEQDDHCLKLLFPMSELTNSSVEVYMEKMVIKAGDDEILRILRQALFS
ncbi:unnamed protein product [Absidia cylindrospora]